MEGARFPLAVHPGHRRQSPSPLDRRLVRPIRVDDLSTGAEQAQQTLHTMRRAIRPLSTDADRPTRGHLESPLHGPPVGAPIAPGGHDLNNKEQRRVRQVSTPEGTPVADSRYCISPAAAHVGLSAVARQFTFVCADALARVAVAGWAASSLDMNETPLWGDRCLLRRRLSFRRGVVTAAVSSCAPTPFVAAPRGRSTGNLAADPTRAAIAPSRNRIRLSWAEEPWGVLRTLRVRRRGIGGCSLPASGTGRASKEQYNHQSMTKSVGCRAHQCNFNRHRTEKSLF